MCSCVAAAYLCRQEIATAIVALLLLVALLLALGTAGTSVIATASVELSTAIQQLNITITSLCTTPDTCAALVSTVFEHIALYIYIVGGVLIGLQVRRPLFRSMVKRTSHVGKGLCRAKKAPGRARIPHDPTRFLTSSPALVHHALMPRPRAHAAPVPRPYSATSFRWW